MILKNAIWVGPGIIASASGENLVRFWDINTHRNYMLPLNSASSNNAEDVHKNTSNSVNLEIITCLAFQSQTGFLSVATSTGAISLWKHCASGPSLNSINTVSYNKEHTPWKPLFRHNTRCLGNGTSVAAQRLYCLPEGDSPLVLVVVTENSVCFAH
jgi:WD40 repeat protein